ncbi:sulfite oxidase isoform X2 [Rhodnius prolixus]|uniref:sulfite oxidase isoform X2 n=1 Tax=Rhodnius prolixus TaxID=13249 RepID=UPI003D18A66F
MNNHIPRALHWFFRNNFKALNRPVVSTFVTLNQDGRKSKRSRYNNHYCSKRATLGFAFVVAALSKDKDEDLLEKFGSARPNLPYYSTEEVSKHNSKDNRIWVTFREGVYDITEFVEMHPGGEVILLAAGAAIDPFWNMYAVHKQEHILEILDGYRIGNLTKEDSDHSASSDDPYASDPKRHPVLKPSSDKPFNGEPPSQVLVQNHITPEELFFVRNHLPVPEVDPDEYELEITGVGLETKIFSLEDLKKMPRYTVTSTVMCAGNRRSEMSQIKPVKGLSWGHAAIGNAEWTGVKLSDLLKKLGVNESSKALHVQFEGLDTDVTNKPYGASIPLSKALDPRGDVLLAYEMNGKPLPRDHGFPVRAVVPGIVGARNVKWLSKIILSEEESDSHWQRNDYKGFSPSVDWDTVDFSKSPAIQELPVISAICVPLNESIVCVDEDEDKIPVKGYAWSGGGRAIIRVDLTCDGGATWHTAKLNVGNERKPGEHVWSWTLWEAELPLPKDADEVVISVKAVDSSYNTQPESFENIWNLRGVLNNAYHRVKVKISKN